MRSSFTAKCTDAQSNHQRNVDDDTDVHYQSGESAATKENDNCNLQYGGESSMFNEVCYCMIKKCINLPAGFPTIPANFLLIPSLPQYSTSYLSEMFVSIVRITKLFPPMIASNWLLYLCWGELERIPLMHLFPFV